MTVFVAGLKIKYLRKQLGLSLQAVADKIGRSVGFISQIERGISQPSVEDLVAIAQMFGVDYSSFFSSRPTEIPGSVVVKSGNRSSLGFRGGISDDLLSPNISGKFHMILTVLDPGGTSGQRHMQDVGEQGGVVLEGNLQLQVNGEIFSLTAGDSFQFESDSPHSYQNIGECPVKVIWVFAIK